MTYKKALLIYNGNAGQTEIKQQLGIVTGILSPAIDELVLVPTKEMGHAEAICKERGGEFDLLLILGGDGTVHECVNGLAELSSPPMIGILPSGTCNDFSRALYIPQQIDKAAETVLEGRTLQTDIGATASGRFFSNFYGIGLITETSENINSELKGMFGKISYFLSALQKVTSASSFPYRLESDHGVMEGEAVMILAANGLYIGTNSLPLTTDSLTDGQLDVFVVREAGIPLLMELLTKRDPEALNSQLSKIDYFRTSRLKVNTPTPMRADTDGEIYLETPEELTVLERKLTFLMGRSG
jgi:YegS/Rv2252/BmrU family lipid kinase